MFSAKIPIFKSFPVVCLGLLLIPSMPRAAERGLKLAAIPMLARSPDSENAGRQSCFAKGVQALEVGDYSDALKLFEHAAATTSIRDNPLVWQTVQFQACQTLNLLGKKTDAIHKAHEIVKNCESNLGGEDPLTSEALSHLAFQLRQHGRLAEAEPVYLKNLKQLEQKHGDDSFFAACARTRLANLRMSLGRMVEAERLHRAALHAARTSLGDVQNDLCFFLTHLAYCLHVGGKSEEAAELMNEAFQIIETCDVRTLTYPGSTLRRQAEFFRDVRQLDKARLTGRLCMEWLASKHTSNSTRFFYYDSVQALYRSILAADGLKPHEIDSHLNEIEQQARPAR